MNSMESESQARLRTVNASRKKQAVMVGSPEGEIRNASKDETKFTFVCPRCHVALADQRRMISNQRGVSKIFSSIAASTALRLKGMG